MDTITDIDEVDEIDEIDEIAIIGVGCRFPDANSPDQFWKNLVQGKESLRDMSDDELRSKGIAESIISDPNFVKRTTTFSGADEFDASFFGINPAAARVTDPQHRILLETVYSAMEDSGYRITEDNEIGLVAGTGVSKYLTLNLLNNVDVGDPSVLFGNDKTYSVTNAAFRLNLNGPCLYVDTACSTSLTAIHIASKALMSYEADMMLAGGCYIQLPFDVGYFHREGGISSSDGRCRSFDKDANGTVFGSGCGVVVLKRLKEAIADRDNIYAVVSGIAINNDGSSKVGFTAPGYKGQSSVVENAQLYADVDADDISYIEAHGTGTALGDPIEVKALTDVFRKTTSQKSFCALGCVKSNLGHLEAAAGIAGLVKVALSFKNKTIPPTLHFKEPNPELHLASGPFFVNTEVMPWNPAAGKRIAGLSSFGIGGSNAHAILEEAPEMERAIDQGDHQLICISAKTKNALERSSINLSEFLSSTKECLTDISYTLKVGRESYPYRRIMVCDSLPSAGRGLATLGDAVADRNCLNDNGKVAFLFSGQGTQKINMFADLYHSDSVYRDVVRNCAEIVSAYMNVDILDILYPPEADQERASQLINDTEYAQPALFIVQIALARQWQAWGISPDVMMGHSLGEYVAACLSGVFSLEDALKVVVMRGRLMQLLPKGDMLAVALPETDIQVFLEGARNDGVNLDLATVNSRSSCVVAGDSKSIGLFRDILDKDDIPFRDLETSHAFHSRMMDPILDQFKSIVSELHLSATEIPIISNLSGTWISAEQAVSSSYWVEHLRGTVRFADGIQSMQEEGMVFLEIGAGKVVGNFVRQLVEAGSVSVVDSYTVENGSALSMQKAMGELWLSGVEQDWSKYYDGQLVSRVSLPTYPFARDKYWVDANNTHQETNPNALDDEKNQDVRKWLYRRGWRLGPISNVPQTDNVDKVILVVTSETVDCGHLFDALKSRYRDAIHVIAGDKYEKLSDREFVINTEDYEDYTNLFSELQKENIAITDVVHLLGVSKGQARHDHTVSDCNYDGFTSVNYFAKALGDLSEEKDYGLWVLTNGLVNLSGETPINESNAVVLGSCRVISQEYSNIKSKHIDIDSGEKYEQYARWTSNQILRELENKDDSEFVVYRNKERFVESYESIDLGVDFDASFSFEKNGTYLITGGLGNLGLLIAEYISQTSSANIILTSRSFFPEESAWDDWLNEHDSSNDTSQKIVILKNIISHGSDVLISKTDVSSLEDMANLFSTIDSKYGVLNGVFHAAGISGPKAFKLIEDITTEVSEAQYKAKVYGLNFLAEHLNGRDVDFCVLMSSLSIPLGGLGNATYCGVNWYMDVFAEKMKQQGENWISVNWDAWHREVMDGDDLVIGDDVRSIDLDDRFQHMSSLLKYSIIGNEGISALLYILSMDGIANIAVSTGDLRQRMKAWRQSSQESLSDRFDMGDELREKLSTELQPPSNELEKRVLNIWKECFGYEDIGVLDNFFELGGDSLLALKILNRMQDAYDVTFHVRAIFEGSSVRELVKYVCTEYPHLSETGIDSSSVKKYELTKDDLAKFRRIITPTEAPDFKTKSKLAGKVVFILSPPRSGSTLLRVILAGNEELFSPPELNLLNYIELESQDVELEQNSSLRNGLLRAVMEIEGDGRVSAEKLISAISAKDQSVVEMYKYLINKTPSKILIEKTPNYSHSLNVLKRCETLFEDAMYIHLIREPEEMIHSYVNARLDLLTDKRVRDSIDLPVEKIAELIWIDCQSNISQFLESIPSARKSRLNFHDLVKKPDETVKNLCDFLGVSYSRDMLNIYDGSPRRMTDGVHKAGKMTGDPNFLKHSSIDAAVIDNWKRSGAQYTISDTAKRLREELFKVDGAGKIDVKQSSLGNIDELTEDEVDLLLNRL